MNINHFIQQWFHNFVSCTCWEYYLNDFFFFKNGSESYLLIGDWFFYASFIKDNLLRWRILGSWPFSLKIHQLLLCCFLFSTVEMKSLRHWFNFSGSNLHLSALEGYGIFLDFLKLFFNLIRKWSFHCVSLECNELLAFYSQVLFLLGNFNFLLILRQLLPFH